MKIVSHNKPTIGAEEKRAVDAVIKRKWLIAGEEVEKFEEALKKRIGVKYAVAVNSGHSALHLALLLLKVKQGDQVIIPSYTVSDVLNSIYYAGAVPILVDIERGGFNMDPEQIKTKISKKTKAIIVPHMYGFPAQIEKVLKYKIPVIEDCAQALGTIYRGKALGSFGDISVFSFYAAKLITTGQGGMIATNSKAHFAYIKDLMGYNAPNNYIVRYNYSMTDISASIGNVQLEKMDSFIQRRKLIAKSYQKILDKKNIQYFPQKSDSKINHFRFILKFSNKKKRDRIHELLVKQGVTAICPLNQYELPHVLLKQNKKDFPNSEDMANTTLSLPIYPALTDEEINYMVNLLGSF